MAFTFTDLNRLNLNSLNEVISLTVGLAGEISKGITVLNGIANNTPVVALTAADKALRKSAGCGGDHFYSGISDKGIWLITREENVEKAESKVVAECVCFGKLTEPEMAED